MFEPPKLTREPYPPFDLALAAVVGFVGNGAFWLALWWLTYWCYSVPVRGRFEIPTVFNTRAFGYGAVYGFYLSVSLLIGSAVVCRSVRVFRIALGTLPVVFAGEFVGWCLGVRFWTAMAGEKLFAATQGAAIAALAGGVAVLPLAWSLVYFRRRPVRRAARTGTVPEVVRLQAMPTGPASTGIETRPAEVVAAPSPRPVEVPPPVVSPLRLPWWAVPAALLAFVSVYLAVGAYFTVACSR